MNRIRWCLPGTRLHESRANGGLRGRLCDRRRRGRHAGDARIVLAWKESGGRRLALLDSLSRIWGVYVPSRYRVTYNLDGTVEKVSPTEDGVAFPVLKRIVQ